METNTFEISEPIRRYISVLGYSSLVFLNALYTSFLCSEHPCFKGVTLFSCIELVFSWNPEKMTGLNFSILLKVIMWFSFS